MGETSFVCLFIIFYHNVISFVKAGTQIKMISCMLSVKKKIIAIRGTEEKGK